MKKNFIILFAIIFATCIFCAKAEAQDYTWGTNFQKITEDTIDISAANWKTRLFATRMEDGTWDVEEDCGKIIFIKKGCVLKKENGKTILIYNDKIQRLTWTIDDKYLTIKMQEYEHF